MEDREWSMNKTIKAILFDLDGTLLDQMEAFWPHYFQALAACLAHILPPEGPKAKSRPGSRGRLE